MFCKKSPDFPLQKLTENMIKNAKLLTISPATSAFVTNWMQLIMLLSHKCYVIFHKNKTDELDLNPLQIVLFLLMKTTKKYLIYFKTFLLM